MCDVAKTVDNGPTHQVKICGSSVVEFNPFTVGEGCPIVCRIAHDLCELDIHHLAGHECHVHGVLTFWSWIRRMAPERTRLSRWLEGKALDG